MLKGCRKNIYYMKNPPGKCFEEAYLILRRDLPCDSTLPSTAANKSKVSAYSDRDLAAEAEFIVKEASKHFSAHQHKVNIGHKAAFALGAISSSAVIGTVALIISII